MSRVHRMAAGFTPCLLFMLLTLALVSRPGAAAPGMSPSTTTTRSAKPAAGSVSDAQLDATLRAKLAKSKVGKDGFKFHVQRGVVTWEGQTEIPQHKGAATRMARTAGALEVVNNIRVSDAGKAKSLSQLHHAAVKPQ